MVIDFLYIIFKSFDERLIFRALVNRQSIQRLLSEHLTAAYDPMPLLSFEESCRSTFEFQDAVQFYGSASFGLMGWAVRSISDRSSSIVSGRLVRCNIRWQFEQTAMRSETDILVCSVRVEIGIV